MLMEKLAFSAAGARLSSLPRRALSEARQACDSPDPFAGSPLASTEKVNYCLAGMSQAEASQMGGAARPAPGSAEAQKAWEDYYQQASLRRRARGGRRHLRDEKRRRLWRERIGIAVSALVVGCLTTVFYSLLMR
jgi:hypothetical protein